MARVGLRCAVVLVAVVLAGLGVLPPAAADRRPEVFDLTPSAYDFQSGDPLSLHAEFANSRAGQLASVQLQTGSTAWRTVGHATVAADGSLDAPVDSLLGVASYRITVGPRWHSAASRPVKVEGALTMRRSSAHEVRVSGQLPATASRPVVLDNTPVDGGAGQSTSADTDPYGRFSFTTTIDSPFAYLTVSAGAVAEAGGTELPGYRSDSTTVPRDATPALLRVEAPPAFVGVPYRESLRPAPDASTGVDLPELRPEAGSIPPGLTFDPATGILAGTPTRSGSYQIVVTTENNFASTDLAVGRAGVMPAGAVRQVGWDTEHAFASADGRFVLSDNATTIVGPNLYPHASIWDRTTGASSWVAPASAAEPASQIPTTAVDLSADGRFALFSTWYPLATGDSGQSDDLYLCDGATGTLSRVTTPASGAPGSFFSKDTGSVSAHGESVAFSVTRGVDPQETTDVYVWTRGSGLLRISSSPTVDAYDLRDPMISGDGRFVAFRQGVRVAGVTVARVALWDRTTKKTTLLPVSGNARTSWYVDSVSDDAGRIVVRSDTDQQPWTRSTGKLTPVPTPPALVTRATVSRAAVLSGSGRFLLIVGSEPNLDTPWRYDLSTRTFLRLKAIDRPSYSFDGVLRPVGVADDGTGAAFRQPGHSLQSWRQTG